jgi:hypothetical protein
LRVKHGLFLSVAGSPDVARNGSGKVSNESSAPQAADFDQDNTSLVGGKMGWQRTWMVGQVLGQTEQVRRVG